MGQIFEVGMLVCFGISWPISVFKSLRSKSASGKSLLFTVVIIIGYIFGIANKIYTHSITYVFWLYIFNIIAVSADLIISVINRKNSKEASERTKEDEGETINKRMVQHEKTVG